MSWIHSERSQRQILEKLPRLLEEILHALERIESKLTPRNITGFTFTENTMPLLPIAPGFSPVITATPTPAGTVLGPGIVATTTSSDATNAPITVDATGLVSTVNIPTTATVGATFTLTTTATNADGTVATTTSQPFTIVAAPPVDVTGFTFAQTV